ncbi:hypothetical protein KKI95_19600 [Xenorhabdus bovienii]|uniref:hypothetical protein n=1 Tax=Xenorhabdus bovienii TaxID=40576 RepID=UPI0023B32F61|nr:hypothetical protein [Xenorhabdus bovienii]MDE9438042.1 hypothetical protein [Xenorhabdus bovienii]MDE9499860.1 hypothetical protein [Xenorhabdus bovienii]MDE9539652.1 hypothetical protein [Xenorhabdus bovienii]
MAIKFMPLTLLPLTLCLTGCDFLSSIISESWHSYRNDANPFFPPQENKWITVEGIVPPNTKPSLKGGYTSVKCLSSHHTAGGTLYHEPNHHWNKFNILVDPKTGYFKEKIPSYGGGWCQWRIDTITISLSYINVEHIMKRAIPYTGTGIKAFINGAKKPESMKEMLNTIDYRPTIYPFLRKDYDVPNQIGLYGKSGGLTYFGLRLIDGNEWKITYKPILDETKMPKIIIPAGNKPSRVEYPDGKVDLDRDSIDYWKINNTSQWE